MYVCIAIDENIFCRIKELSACVILLILLGLWRRKNAFTVEVMYFFYVFFFFLLSFFFSFRLSALQKLSCINGISAIFRHLLKKKKNIYAFIEINHYCDL